VLAVYNIFEANKLKKEAFPPLIDTRLAEEEEKTILKIIETFQQEFIEIHDFRTRRSGPQEYIDFHLIVASLVTIKDVHDLCDRIERDITNEF
ncbi:cation transporter dimerization domain-containing protein, partial [Bacillus sp. GbtcB15]|uniref:cation transporter dimerization domain-containing protein n=1 Tax=Bacillus sp. GbtcB15 TaxID=2824760 RepID=UPI0027D2A034